MTTNRKRHHFAEALSFNATLNKELIHLHVWTTIKQLRTAIF